MDRFGNLITNIGRDALTACGRAPIVQIGPGSIARVVSTYGEAPAHALCALVGSGEYLEIAINGGSAADTLGLGRGAAVHVRRGA